VRVGQVEATRNDRFPHFRFERAPALAHLFDVRFGFQYVLRGVVVVGDAPLAVDAHAHLQRRQVADVLGAVAAQGGTDETHDAALGRLGERVAFGEAALHTPALHGAGQS
jgi:hypothetical protein